jgi:multisubunit Na+/H+ antiporter MnhB subunit
MFEQITTSKWFLPLFAVVLGLLVFVAQWIGGNPGSGLVSFAILAGAGLLFLLGGRSETIRGLRGDGRDERFRRIDVHATALAGLAVITAIIFAFLVELARGHSGNPYGWLGAIGGITYIAAIIIFRIRG